MHHEEGQSNEPHESQRMSSGSRPHPCIVGQVFRRHEKILPKFRMSNVISNEWGSAYFGFTFIDECLGVLVWDVIIDGLCARLIGESNHLDAIILKKCNSVSGILECDWFLVLGHHEDE